MSEGIDILHSAGDKKTGEELREQYAAFLSMTTHDLLAPLRKLGVLTDRLTQKYSQPEDEEIAQYTTRIHTCIDEMRSLIEGCRQIAQTIPQNMEVEEVDVNKLISEMIHEKAFRINESGAHIEVGELPVLEGDRKQLELLFREIIENALVFKKKDTPLKLDIRCEPLPEKEMEKFGFPVKEYWKIIFSDNGIGFEADESERIFDPTIRLHGKSAYPGNGMGLTLVKKIVSNHQGCVYAEGSMEGSRFIVILPKIQNEHATGK